MIGFWKMSKLKLGFCLFLLVFFFLRFSHSLFFSRYIFHSLNRNIERFKLIHGIIKVGILYEVTKKCRFFPFHSIRNSDQIAKAENSWFEVIPFHSDRMGKLTAETEYVCNMNIKETVKRNIQQWIGINGKCW